MPKIENLEKDASEYFYLIISEGKKVNTRSKKSNLPQISGIYIHNSGKIRFWQNIFSQNVFIDEIVNDGTYITSCLKLQVKNRSIINI